MASAPIPSLLLSSGAKIPRVGLGVWLSPKSVNEGRIAENVTIFDFELDPGSMRRLDALDEGAAAG